LMKLKYDEYVSSVQRPEITGPKCAICATPQGARRLARDHCHRTGLRRGDLCIKCNLGIGYFNDDLELMMNAIRYLRHYGAERP
jgi:hypothetical protein